mgnify:CR=1 FL=1
MQEEAFVHFLRTGLLANYKAGVAFNDIGLEYLGEGPIDGKYYALNDWATLWVSTKNLITMIEVNVKAVDFKEYMNANFDLKIFNLKRVLNFLELQNLQWVIDEDWTYSKQLTIILQSRVQLYFVLNKQLEYMLTGISIADFSS